MRNSLIDRVGQRYGKIVVLRRAENRKKITYWLCRCDCGKEFEIQAGAVAKTKSCRECFFETRKGVENLVGRRFGSLVVTEKSETQKNGIHTWKCQCDCGNFTSTRHTRLLNGETTSCKSCGTTVHGRCKEQEYRLFIEARNRAKNKGLTFNLSLDDIFIPEKCPALDIPLIRRKTGKQISLTKEDKEKGIKYRLNDSSISLDRIDSTKGYIKGNVWVISSRANRIKNNSTPNELRKIADAVEIKMKENK